MNLFITGGSGFIGQNLLKNDNFLKSRNASGAMPATIKWRRDANGSSPLDPSHLDRAGSIQFLINTSHADVKFMYFLVNSSHADVKWKKKMFTQLHISDKKSQFRLLCTSLSRAVGARSAISHFWEPKIPPNQRIGTYFFERKCRSRLPEHFGKSHLSKFKLRFSSTCTAHRPAGPGQTHTHTDRQTDKHTRARRPGPPRTHARAREENDIPFRGRSGAGASPFPPSLWL